MTTKGERTHEANHGSYVLDVLSGPLMFSGGSIVSKSRHDWNVIMSVLKLLSQRMGRAGRGMLKNG